MNSLILAAICFALYIVAYRTYGQYLSKKIFGLRNNRTTPAHRLKDGIDFVPTKKDVVFGHHFTSIAGTGPIVGPAIGVIWGWLPALVWVVLGPIFIGAIHDMGSLVISIRNDGKSVAEIIGKTISPRVRNLFFVIVFLELWIVIAIFALIIAILFGMYPNSVLAVWIEIPIALWIGAKVRSGNANLLVLSIIGVTLMYIAVIAGNYLPIKMPQVFGLSPILVWMLILFLYAGIASAMPVDLLLQPRDYLNSHQLLIAMALLFGGLVVSHPPIVAPAVITNPQGAPSMFPFLFVVIACGAVSGFHALVSSGTSSKQLNRETDALFVGFGSMLFEGALAVLVIMACTAGIGLGIHTSGGTLTGSEAFAGHYASWASANGLGAQLSAFIEGAANMITCLGISRNIAITIMGVFIVSFAATTLDTATRIQRYVISELAEGLNFKRISGRIPATCITVGTAMALAFYSGDGKGAMTLWPIFGAVNQLLASLALLSITAYLIHKNKNIIVTLPAMIFMVITTSWAMVGNASNLLEQKNYFLGGLSVLTLALQAWMLTESWIILSKRTKEIEPQDDKFTETEVPVHADH
ncbi:MAG: carbon starvation protein A [Proteobacteria bacterium]|nr:carbon starvation protein A [Pseudomonadota bacterium]